MVTVNLPPIFWSELYNCLVDVALADYQTRPENLGVASPERDAMVSLCMKMRDARGRTLELNDAELIALIKEVRANMDLWENGWSEYDTDRRWVLQGARNFLRKYRVAV